MIKVIYQPIKGRKKIYTCANRPEAEQVYDEITRFMLRGETLELIDGKELTAYRCA